MADENSRGSDQPQQRRQRRQRRIERQRRSKGPRDEAESKDTPRCSLPTGDEDTPAASLETGQQEAAASREQGWEQGWEQDDAVPGSPPKSSPPHTSDLDSAPPRAKASLAGSDPQSTEPEEVNNSHDNDETRWISQQDLERLIPQGIRLYQSEATDAIFYLGDRGERVWLVDKNGDCIMAQTRTAADSTPESSPEEANT